jgi:S1-C subfamily serine protease
MTAADIHRGLEGAELADAAGGGVVVRSVEANSTAAQNGLRPDDVIIGVGRRRVDDLAELRAATENANAFALTLRRGNARIVTVIR